MSIFSIDHPEPAKAVPCIRYLIGGSRSSLDKGTMVGRAEFLPLIRQRIAASRNSGIQLNGMLRFWKCLRITVGLLLSQMSLIGSNEISTL